MTSPRNAMEAVARGAARSNELPSDMSILLEEADRESENADVDLPLLELQPSQVEHVTISNSDYLEAATDENGNEIGRIYLSEYEMTIDIDIWVTANDGYDVDSLGESLRRALYPYSDYGPGEPFIDGDGNQIDDIFYFRINSGERADNLLSTPTVRRWSHEVELWGTEQFDTTKDYIVDVDYPSSGDLNDSDSDNVIDST